MTYDRFESLPVWKAMALAHGVFDLVDHRAFFRLGDLRNQLQRASLSISNNIAEGFERGTTAELLTFIYIARGSAAETRSGLLFTFERPEMTILKAQITPLIASAESVSRQLRAWAGSLQNSDIGGQRKLSDATFKEYQQRKRADAFMKKLDTMRARNVAPKISDEGNGEKPI